MIDRAAYKKTLTFAVRRLRKALRSLGREIAKVFKAEVEAWEAWLWGKR